MTTPVMPTISGRAVLATIAKTCDKLDVKAPKTFIENVENAAAITAQSEEIHVIAAGTPEIAVQALVDGAAPLDNPDVLRACIAKVLADNGIRHSVAERFNELVVEQINEHADQIVDSWNNALSGDFAALARGADELTDVRDLAAADTNMLRRTDRLNVWADASSALDRVEQAALTLRGILNALHISVDRTSEPLLIAVDADAVSLDAARAAAGARSMNGWDLSRAGAPLRLASPSSFIENVGRLTAERQTRATTRT